MKRYKAPTTDVDMLNNPESWPRWPALPMKRDKKGAFPEHGFLLAVENVPRFDIHIGSIFDYECINKAARNEVKAHHYESAEAIIADGWQVD